MSVAVRTYPLTSTLLCLTLFTSACGDSSTASTTGDASTTGEPGTTGGATTGQTTGDATAAPTTGDATTSPTTATPTSAATTGADTTDATSGQTTGDTTAGTDGDASTGGIDSTTDADTSTTDASTTDASSSSGGDEGLGQDAKDIAAELEVAVDGVLYTSEGEDIWHVVTFADVAPVTEQNLKEVIKDVYVQNPNEQPLVDRTIEVHTFPWLFDPITVPQPWWDDGYYEQAEKYAPIRMIFEMKLENLQVFRLGEKQGNVLSGAIDVYVLGETAGGDVVGMWSTAIET